MATIHVCDLCGEKIQPDARYKVSVGKIDGDHVHERFTGLRYEICFSCSGRVRDWLTNPRPQPVEA